MSTPVEEDLANLSFDVGGVPPEGDSVDAEGKGIAAGEGTNDELDDTVCAICLNKTPVSETAQPDCCEHTYCACCILHWAVYKEKAWCPQCKAPFSNLLTFRTLDGHLRDYPVRESVCLLKCAGWFQDHVKMRERAIAESGGQRPPIAGSLEGSVIDDSDYVDYARYYDEYDDDEEVESYYFSAAAGRARIVIGNRRHGPNGFISSGRMQARPAASTPQAKVKEAKAGEGSSNPRRPGHARELDIPKGNSTPHKGRGKGPSSALGSDDGSPSGSTGKQSAGRRARRNQRKAAADAKAGF